VLVPFTAREALLGRAEAERLVRSNRAQLDKVLEERFFARAEMIKREAAVHRLGTILDEARARGERLAASGGEREAAVVAAQAKVREAQGVFARRFLVEERLRLREALDELLSRSAREVLDFVRPRRWAFGSHQAQPADRDFLVALAEERVAALAEGSRARVAARAEEALAPVRAVDDTASPVDALRALDAEVYGRYRAFARGFLRGGRVDDFFARALPKLELSEPAIRRALEQALLPSEVLDAELVTPLSVWAERLHAGLLGHLARLSDAEGLRRFEVEERLVRPVAALQQALARHTATS
jgi:hypothetical protein